MTTQTFQKNPTSTWDKMVHAPFKKVVAFDLLCMAIGMPIGAGILAAFIYGAEPVTDALQTVSKIWGG